MACLSLLAGLTAAFYWRCLFTAAVFLPTDLCLRLQPWRAYSRQLFPEFERVYNPLLDAILLFYPWRVLAARAITAGTLPLWNPDSFSGQPFLANISSAVLYPLNVFFYLMDPARAYGLVAALHTFLAGAFVFLFLRLLGARRSAAVLGGVVFMFCGFLTVWAQYQTPVAATVWLPLALYFWERGARGHGRRFALYAAFPLGMSLLGGHLQYASYVLVAFAAYACWRSRLRPLPCLAAGVVLGLGIALAAHQIIPSLEMGRYNHRVGGQPLAAVLSTGLPAGQLVSLLVPNFFGNIVDYNYWGSFNFVEYCGYLGVVPLLLAALAVALRRDGQTRFFALLAAVVLLMVLGTPLYAPLYYLPGFKQLSNPARLLGIFSLAVACLAALGADRIAALPAERRRTLLIGVVALSLGACAWVSLTYTHHAAVIADYGLQGYVAWQVALFFLLAIGAGGTVVAAAVRPTAHWLLPALAAADLFLFGMRFNPAGDPRMLFFPTESVRIVRAQPAPFRVLALPASGNDFMNAMIPNCNLVVGLPEVQGGDAVYPRRYREFAEFIESRHQGSPVKIGNGLGFSSVETPGLEYLGPNYVLSATPIDSPHLELLASPDLHLYRNRRARPRAFFVHQARVEPPSRVLEAMAAEQFALDRKAFVESAPALPLQPAAGPESATITHLAFGRVVIRARATANALLILADQYFPGWQATLDGRPVSVQPANYVMRAVAVPPGEHTVEFRYRPATFLLGLYLTLLTTGLLIGTAVGHRVYVGKAGKPGRERTANGRA